MRDAFFRMLTRVADEDPQVWLVVADLGFGAVNPFLARHGARFLNVGICEQTLISVGAGMALAGKKIFVYSIGNFATLRCLEQIRNDVCLHHADVTIVSVGAGYAYGAQGPTHHATNDLAAMRAIPGITIVAPGDPVEVEAAVRELAQNRGPAYLRLGRSGETRVHVSPPSFKIGRALTVRAGSDLTIVSTGGMLVIAMETARRLAACGIEANVLSMHTLMPIDAGALIHAAQETGMVVTMEDHVAVGGLGGAAAEVLSQADIDRPWRLQIFALPNSWPEKVGSHEYLMREAGLDPEIMASKIMKIRRA